MKELERGGGGESESLSSLSKSELEFEGSIIAAIIVFVTAPKKPEPKAEKRGICFYILLSVKERYKLRRALEATWRKRAVEK